MAASGEEYLACLDIAEAELDHCWASNGLLGPAVGAIVGCMVRAMAGGAGLGGVAAVKAVLIWCGVGGIVGAVVAIAQCYLRYDQDLENCMIRYTLGARRCVALHCDVSDEEATAPSLPVAHGTPEATD